MCLGVGGRQTKFSISTVEVYPPHFTYETSEAQKRKAVCSKSPSGSETGTQTQVSEFMSSLHLSSLLKSPHDPSDLGQIKPVPWEGCTLLNALVLIARDLREAKLGAWGGADRASTVPPC